MEENGNVFNMIPGGKDKPEGAEPKEYTYIVSTKDNQVWTAKGHLILTETYIGVVKKNWEIVLVVPVGNLNLVTVQVEEETPVEVEANGC
jgi:hypothetical protein